MQEVFSDCRDDGDRHNIMNLECVRAACVCDRHRRHIPSKLRTRSYGRGDCCSGRAVTWVIHQMWGMT